MNIIAISDIYEKFDIIEELVSEIKSKGLESNLVLILAGDLGVYNVQREDEYISNLKRIMKKLLEVASKIIYVCGEYDKKNLDLEMSNVYNVSNNFLQLDTANGRIGFLGLGGAPSNSIRSKSRPFCHNIWDEKLVLDGIKKNLEINYEKVQLSNPDKIVLVSHTPPYRIADYSKELSIDQTDEIETTEIEEAVDDVKKTAVAPKHLGSKALSAFLYKKHVDFCIFGHVYKGGGIALEDAGKHFFNVSHLAPLPYKLTARKYLLIKDITEPPSFEFHSVVNPNLKFEEYVESYL